MRSAIARWLLLGLLVTPVAGASAENGEEQAVSYPEPPAQLQRSPERLRFFDDRLRLRVTALAKGIYFDDFAAAPDREDEEIEALGRLRLRADLVLNESVDARVDGRVNLRWRRDFMRDEELRVDGELTEAWVRLRTPTGPGRSFLQLGRSRLREPRGWWWDEEFESIRLGYGSELWELQFGVGERLSQDEIDDDGRRDLRDELTWLFGELSYQWFFDNRLEVRWLTQIDRDRGASVGQRTDRPFADEDVTWLGLSARGRTPQPWLGLPARYWIDVAWSGGTEARLTTNPGSRVVVLRESNYVSGVGLDLGATLETSLPCTPAVTLAYAVGSADFRQPALKRNRDSLAGYARFRFYGEVLRPQLANLHVLTTSLGVPVGPHLWLETAFHQYFQYRRRSELRENPFSQTPDGGDDDLGRAIDVVLSLRPDGPWIFDVAYGVFWSGAAYDARGRDAHRVNLRLGRHFQ